MKKEYSLFNKLYWDNKRPLIKNEVDPLPHISDKINSFSTLPSQRSFRDVNLVMLESRVPTALGTNAKRPDSLARLRARQAPSISCTSDVLAFFGFSNTRRLCTLSLSSAWNTFHLLFLLILFWSLWLSHTACGILETEVMPLHWEHGVLTTGPPGKVLYLLIKKKRKLFTSFV